MKITPAKLRPRIWKKERDFYSFILLRFPTFKWSKKAIRESDAWGKGGQQIISQQIIVQVNANNEFFTALKRRREQQVIRNPLYF